MIRGREFFSRGGFAFLTQGCRNYYEEGCSSSLSTCMRTLRRYVNLLKVATICTDRFYWVTLDLLPSNLPAEIIAFTTDRELIYEPFNNDFGPLDLGALTKYCRALHHKLHMTSKSGGTLVHFTSTLPNKRSNAACLALCYLVAVERIPAEEAWSRLSGAKPKFTEFVDASQVTHPFTLSILDVLKGLETAVGLGWYNWKTFDLADFEFGKKVENGDMTWIIPKKFLAFAGPFDDGVDEDGIPSCKPESYYSHFRRGGITAIVRLNKRQYDANKFTRAGFKHYDLIFNDGSCPPDNIREAFLELSAREPALAVHCKAGLGRTGTLIALHAMIHHKFPARPFMGWIRLCRPGSILGVQQQYLCDMESVLLSPESLPKGLPRQTVFMTEEMIKGEVGQGEGLNKAKRSSRKYSSSTVGSYNSSMLSLTDD